LLLYNPLIREAFATSPSFGYQEIRNEPFDWIDMMHKHVRSISGDPSTDILGVNYFSDGKTLNATLWLFAPFNSNVTKDRGQINYGMYVDADAKDKTGVGGINYQVEIRGQNGMWSKTFSQWSSFGSNRTLSKMAITQDNYTGFFGKNGRYVLLSLDLNAIGSPELYRVIFYADQIKGSKWLTDFTNWIQLPPPKFEISTLPTSVDIGQGYDKTLAVQIKSTTGFQPTIYLYSDNQKFTKFNPTKVYVPSYGMAMSHLTISIPLNADTGTNTINLFAKATFPKENFTFPSSKSTNTLANFNLKLPSFVGANATFPSVTSQYSLTLNIQPFWQPVLDWLNQWQSLITFILGIITGKVATRIFNKVVTWISNKIRAIR
jgi:hypothetical protein